MAARRVAIVRRIGHGLRPYVAAVSTRKRQNCTTHQGRSNDRSWTWLAVAFIERHRKAKQHRSRYESGSRH